MFCFILALYVVGDSYSTSVQTKQTPSSASEIKKLFETELPHYIKKLSKLVENHNEKIFYSVDHVSDIEELIETRLNIPKAIDFYNIDYSAFVLIDDRLWLDLTLIMGRLSDEFVMMIRSGISLTDEKKTFDHICFLNESIDNYKLVIPAVHSVYDEISKWLHRHMSSCEKIIQKSYTLWTRPATTSLKDHFDSLLPRVARIKGKVAAVEKAVANKEFCGDIFSDMKEYMLQYKRNTDGICELVAQAPTNLKHGASDAIHVTNNRAQQLGKAKELYVFISNIYSVYEQFLDEAKIEEFREEHKDSIASLKPAAEAALKVHEDVSFLRPYKHDKSDENFKGTLEDEEGKKELSRKLKIVEDTQKLYKQLYEKGREILKTLSTMYGENLLYFYEQQLELDKIISKQSTQIILETHRIYFERMLQRLEHQLENVL
eukprot:GAHX01000794.1.p1 GENE.GAHX01000794.1~~GAHX01000794.1.p1  ORF type:complete len:432 (-),score=68.52 GAHX01000794.1:98-1393(-)